MYYIIGLYKDGDKIEALKLYDGHSKQVGLYPKENVLHAAQSYKFEIAGLNKKMVGDRCVIRLSHSKYNTKMLDLVDTTGQPIDDNHVRVAIKTRGFKESMIVTLLDSMGNTEEVGYKKLLELMKAGKVTGVEKKKYFVFNKWCIKEGITCN